MGVCLRHSYRRRSTNTLAPVCSAMSMSASTSLAGGLVVSPIRWHIADVPGRLCSAADHLASCRLQQVSGGLAMRRVGRVGDVEDVQQCRFVVSGVSPPGHSGDDAVIDQCYPHPLGSPPPLAEIIGQLVVRGCMGGPGNGPVRSVRPMFGGEGSLTSSRPDHLRRIRVDGVDPGEKGTPAVNG